MRPGRRALVLASLAALLVAGVLADHLVGRPRPAQAKTAGPGLPSLAPSGSLSSTWFCPAAMAAPNSLADGWVIIGNPTDRDLSGTVTVLASQGPPHLVAVAVAARHRASLRLGDTAGAPYAAALVQLDGPAGAVEEQIRGPLGESTSPCATQASDHWYFAAGSTNPGAQTLISLFNPFPGDAIVDFDFATDTGRATPGDLQGVVVPAQGVAVFDLGQYVRRRQVISTTVAVRNGRLVAAKIELLGAAAPPAKTSGPRGATLTLGVPVPGTTWYFADGVAADGVDERYEVYNPTDHEADVSVALLLDRGSADPFSLTVAPHDRATLAVNGESRIPPGVAHAGTVQSTNGVGVVVERVITAGPPSPHLGVTDVTGAPVMSAHWVFVAGAANSVQDEWLVGFNPGTTVAHLSVTALLTGQPLSIEGLQAVELQPGERVAMRLGDHLLAGDLMVTVAADGPVVVERDLYRIGAVGMSASAGVAGP